MKNSLFTLIISLLFLTGFSLPKPIEDIEEGLLCVTEPGKPVYLGTEKCCGDLTLIFGAQLEDGSCWCTEEDNVCGGASICAPCGNNKCEPDYGEDPCNCPEDCL